MNASELPAWLLTGVVMLLVVGPLGVVLVLRLRQLWLAAWLRRRGIHVLGQVVDRRQCGAATVYRVRLTTQTDQLVEEDSAGWRLLPDPSYANGVWSDLRYDDAQPARFMLKSELSLVNLLPPVALLLVMWLLL